MTQTRRERDVGREKEEKDVVFNDEQGGWRTKRASQ